MGSGSNFFQSILSSFFGGDSPEAVKKRQLKTVAKNLSKAKYHFYKFSSNTVDPSLAKFFYDIYKVISPAQVMFQNATPNLLKKIVLSACFSEKQHQQIDSISEEAILEQARGASLKELSASVQQTYREFSKEFDSAKVREIDEIYTKLIIFSNFCKYDFYFILKKFDNGFRERDFNSLPHFQPINGTYVGEDLKNFIACANSLPLDADWEPVMSVLKKFKGVEPVTLQAWKKILNQVKNVRARGVFEMMVQLINEDPSYRDLSKPEELHIMDEYLGNVRKQVEDVLGKLKEQQTAGKIDGLLTQIFGTTQVDELNNYTNSNSAMFERKNTAGYIYCDPLRFLKRFLLDYTKKEVRELSDILLVRGEWANQKLASPMSEAYHQLLGIAEKIVQLDAKLAENGEYGMKLKTLLPRADRDKEAHNIIKMVLGDANNEAAELIVRSSQYFVTYDKNLKVLLEDFVKAPRSELVLNWKDLDHFAEGRLKTMCVDTYKKIYLFVSLMQTYQVSVRG